MGVLSNLEPKEVFYYFEELSKVPRATFDMDRVSDFCVAFAKEHGLEYIQDEVKNVIIKKPGTPGYEDSDPVIIQGHLDMVAVKTDDSDHDFTKDPLELFVDGNLIGAKGTSLGGDDGIAIAYAMAILASDDIPHPPIEALFTIDEEIGMGGASGVDMSQLKGKYLLNLDSEEEGIMTVGCAGGYVWNTYIPFERTEETGTKITIDVKGLNGGHSGMEITKQNGNAHKIMGRVLFALSKEYDFNLISIDGGTAANVIAQFNTAKLIADSSQAEAIVKAVEAISADIVAEFLGQEPAISITAEVEGEGTEAAFDAEATSNVISYLYGAPDGVQCYDRTFPGEPETSLNTGIVATEENHVMIRYQIRSAMKTKLKDMENKMTMWCDMVGASYELTSAYPAWKFDPNSRLRPMAIELFEKLFGKELRTETTHGGLECGILFDKKPDLDIVSFGPNLFDVHSVKERVDIDSTARMWEYLKALLKNCK